ncbi:MerR family transcriptional regulator [Demequina aestuarii]|uniref:MerR family transcriptional regulator n=1 Tax=Demequina aestuarii TaxID=327095 RepID=UPI0007860161|nr:MerR family transcriptional regulator [Demequina aestuarii]
MTVRQGRTIGDVAHSTGLTEDTLRYYEREGLVGPIDRDASGHRRYGDNEVAWIGVVTCLREAGLGIADLRRFTSLLRADGVATERSEFLRQRRAELVRQADALAAAITVLDDKIAHYSDDPS